jgi:hypothetical protein
MAALQPIEQQPFALGTAHRAALGGHARQGYHQVRAGLITPNRQRRRAQRTNQQIAAGEQFPPYPAQVPGEVSGHRERGEHPLTGR